MKRNPYHCCFIFEVLAFKNTKTGYKIYWRQRKNVNRKVQGMPQSQTAANLRHQEEEKKDKNTYAQNKQANVREAQRPAPSSPSEEIRMLKQTEIRAHRAREDFKIWSAPWYKLQSYTVLNTVFGRLFERFSKRHTVNVLQNF